MGFTSELPPLFQVIEEITASNENLSDNNLRKESDNINLNKESVEDNFDKDNLESVGIDANLDTEGAAGLTVENDNLSDISRSNTPIVLSTIHCSKIFSNFHKFRTTT